jgi:hypothetical protein
LYHLIAAVSRFYEKRVVVLIDEYDTTIISAHRNGFQNDLGNFFSHFFNKALKGNTFLHKALLTGIHQVAIEGQFRAFDTLRPYSVLSRQYSQYFVFTAEEAAILLQSHELDTKPHNGYRFGDVEVFNSSYILSLTEQNPDLSYEYSSIDRLISISIASASASFFNRLDELLKLRERNVTLELQTSFLVRNTDRTLWAQLVNAGILTVLNSSSYPYCHVCIANDDARKKLTQIVQSAALRADGFRESKQPERNENCALTS